MNFNFGIGRTGVALAALIAIAMCVLSLLYKPVEIIPVEYGICLPSPDSWNFDPIWSWGINTFIIGIIAILLYLVNKSYNFIRTTEPALPAIFLVMAASSPWFTMSINTSVLLCLANVIGMGIIFDSYDTRNATQQMFILGIVIGGGSMVQYAFLPMAGVYFLWALFMKVLRYKETLAFLAGIICPYWIGLGIGWIQFSDLHFPSLSPFFGVERDYSDLLLLLVGVSIAGVMGFLVAMTNFMKIFAGNSKVYAMNLCVYALGAASAICILVDYDNLPAYVETLYMACAVQLANICAVWTPKYPALVTLIPSLIYILIFAGSIVL